MKTAIIIPSNRLDRLQEMLAAWEQADGWPDKVSAGQLRVLVVEDHPTPEAVLPPWVEHYCHQDFAGELGDKAACIPTYAGGCRSFAVWKAAQDSTVDMVLSLDDDCLPLEGHDLIDGHWQMLEAPRPLRWTGVAPEGLTALPRGFPYGIGPKGEPYGGRHGIKPVLNHGLWAGIPDLDAMTQLAHPDMRCYGTNENELIPYHAYFTHCIMNVAFRPSIAPLMYFPVMPDGMKRWDDIWCGVILKRVCDMHDLPVTSGFPCVHHSRASNVWNNLRQEVGGLEINEEFWRVVDKVPLAGVSLVEDYAQVAFSIGRAFPALKSMAESMLMWSELWTESRWKR